jgi:hypothetical protein
MKKINKNSMAITSGGSDRSCAQLGVSAAVATMVGVFFPPVLAIGVGILIEAQSAGCL